VSGVLKAGDGAALTAVRSLPVQPQAAPGHAMQGQGQGQAAERLPSHEAPVPFLDRAEELDRQCIELEAEIAELRHRLTQADPAAQQKEDAAYERGLEEGARRAHRTEDERTALAAKALDRLRQAHDGWLAEYELLALQLARTALGRVFGDERLQADLVAATLGNSLAAIRREMVVKARVSPLDFQDAAALAELSRRFPGIEITGDDGLRSGDCAVDLRLGQIDLGLEGQWGRLSAFFDTLAGEEAAP